MKTKRRTFGGPSLGSLESAALLLALGACSGCKEAAGSTSRGSALPAGEVALSVDEIQQSRILVEAMSDQEIDDTLVATGRVTFEDVKVGHVFLDVSQASSDVAKAEADLVAAEHGLQREKDLLAKSATSQKDYDGAEDAYRQARAERERASQKAFLLRTGSVDVVTADYSLVSPLDGEVLARNLSVGAEVQGQYGGGTQELFVVGALDEIWVLADVYEVDLARVHAGAKCVVHTVAYPDKEFEGRVDWVAGMLDPSTRTVKTRCTFANGDGSLKPDMYATATISVAPHRVPAVPKAAILHLGAQTVVFLDHGAGPNGKHRFERVPVSVDEALGGRWLPVLHGLNPGDSVVTEGAETLESKI